MVAMDVNSKPKHCKKVPYLYKTVSNLLQKYEEQKGSLKTLVYNAEKNVRIARKQTVIALLSSCIDNYNVLYKTLESVNLFEENPRFNKYLAVTLASEMLLKGKIFTDLDIKPFEVIMDYKDKLIQEYHKIPEHHRTIRKSTYPKFARVNKLLTNMTEVEENLSKEGYCKATYEPSYQNFLKMASELVGNQYIQDYHFKDLLVFPTGTSFYESALYQKGHLILQSKSSCIPVNVSGIKKSMSVLDACAAPGNKTLQIAAKVGKYGNVIAIDQSKKRGAMLHENLKKHGANNVKVIIDDFLNFNAEEGQKIDHVLVDPSCSGSGGNHHADKPSIDRLKILADFQCKALCKALSLPTVQSVCYSTCSREEIENEAVVARVLKKFDGSVVLEDLSTTLKEWRNFGLGKYDFKNCCLRTDPDRDLCTAFFVAKFIKRYTNNISIDKKSNVNGHEDYGNQDTMTINGNENHKENVEINGVNPDEITDPKKSKKKRRTSETDCGEDSKNEYKENDVNEEYSKPKKSKKKKKDHGSDYEDDSKTNNGKIENEECSKPKKSKKKRKENEYDHCEDSSVADYVHEENFKPKKSKKKKKDNQDESCVDLTAESDNSLNESKINEEYSKPKKSKKKKKEKQEDSLIDLTIETESNLNGSAIYEEPSKPKKSKKKNKDKKEDSIVGLTTENTLNESAINEEFSKPKKSKKKNKEKQDDSFVDLSAEAEITLNESAINEEYSKPKKAKKKRKEMDSDSPADESKPQKSKKSKTESDLL